MSNGRPGSIHGFGNRIDVGGGVDWREDGPFGSYTWSVSGNELTLTASKEGCGDRLARLTELSRPRPIVGELAPVGGRLSDRVVVVTGAGSGIGRAAALLFADEGAAVGCVDLDADAAKAVAAEVGAAGGRATGLGADVTDGDEIERAVAET